MDEQLRLLQQIAERLDSAGIPYMVTGSMALATYATPRMTRDIDLVVELEPTDVDQVIALFETDCYIDRDAVCEAIRTRSIFNIIHTEWVIKADFVVRGDEPYRREEFRRRRPIVIGEQTVSFVSPEDLILSKLCWSQISPSELQERDVGDLLASVADLDEAYLAHWAEVLGISSSLERLRP